MSDIWAIFGSELVRNLRGHHTWKDRVTMLASLDPAQFHKEVRSLLMHIHAIRTFPRRHLADEVDIVVPIILHHKLRE